MKKLLKKNSKKLTGQHEVLTGDLSGLEGDCSNLYGNVIGLWGDCSHLKGDVSGLKGNCTDICGDCSNMTGDVSGLKGDCSNLRGYISNLRGYVSNLQGNCTCLTGDCTGLTGNCGELVGSCTFLKGNVSGLEGDCTDLEGDLDDCGITDEERENGIDINDLIDHEKVHVMQYIFHWLEDDGTPLFHRNGETCIPNTHCKTLELRCGKISLARISQVCTNTDKYGEEWRVESPNYGIPIDCIMDTSCAYSDPEILKALVESSCRDWLCDLELS